MNTYNMFFRDLAERTTHSEFASITPHFGKYTEEKTLRDIEDFDLVVSQLVTSDVIFSRKNILEMRPNKETIFTPYFYLTGFRRMEKNTSKGNVRVDGAKYLVSALDTHAKGKALNMYLTGEIDTENGARLAASLGEMERRESLGADVCVADYVRQTYQERLPCYSINHPTPHVLQHVYNQIASLAGFKKADLAAMSHRDRGRKVLPDGIGALTPYCVEALNLQYTHPDHWFSRLNSASQYVATQHAAKREIHN